MIPFSTIGSLRIGRVGTKLGDLDAVLVNDLDDEIGLGDEEAGLQLLHAVLNDGDGLVLGEALLPIAVHDGKAEAGGIALAAVVDLLEGGHVVQEVEGAGLGAGVVSAEEDVDLIRTAAEGGGQLSTHEVGLGVRRELHPVVGQLVEGNVLLDVLAEVDEVRIRSGNAEGRMARQRHDLVQILLVHEDRPGVSLIGRYDDATVVFHSEYGIHL
mmetsp:Transcript_13582/g.22608  ORF Transcript_13582/g.22608 Transcript_13582/m.22608 type:complete len:213 (+) Transcript_13582:115-753(+)